MARKTKIEGLSELQGMFKQLEKVPQAVATKSARAGAAIVRGAAKSNAPVDEGNLKKAIVLKREKKRIKAKATYQVTIDPKMNDQFVKQSKDGERSYYPASQEYGFMTKNGKYIPGYRYMRKSAEENEQIVEKKILEVAGKEVDKALAKGR